MSSEEYTSPPATTARDAAIEALLTEKALWGLLGCVFIIVITMCTQVDLRIPWYPLNLALQGFAALFCLSISTIVLRSKANDGGSNGLAWMTVGLLCSVSIVVGLYNALYVGLYGLFTAILSLWIIDGIERVLILLAGAAIIRDAVRLILAVPVFSPGSPVLARMEDALREQYPD